MSRNAITVLLLLCAGLSLEAQSWDTLRALKPGDHIKVIDSAAATHTGVFSAFSVDAISLTTGAGELAIERARVHRIQVRSGSRRSRNALIGAAIGVALGATVDLTLGAYFRNEVGETSGARAITYVAPITVFGSLGAAFPAYRTVYRAR